ncbi:MULTISPECIES: endonuclease V [unclassified Luteimonas]|uniref:endonuclease V n=1 Tax=unclassified Luteimonas TaxID=2629088 RepID=UPI0018F0F322|nr:MULTISPECIES: endonuclease V [unclassified Luteimonas]MBJ6982536.1 endonuclease V [Luteimonas sp. MC1572]MBJ7574886.1 endonuclease V [Luteimonas sp. MC1828]QQO03788.1 endonuclease V [Luteimonas sp. MC1572]
MAMPTDHEDPPDLASLPSAAAGELELRDRFTKPLRTIAGFHARAEDDGATVRGAAVLLDADTLELMAGEVVSLGLPGGADRASFDALPVLLAALKALPRPPDLAFIHGHGGAHPDHAGIATRFGVTADLPCIGVADTIVAGGGPEPHETRGAYTALRSQVRGPQIGWLLRSKPGSAPLVVSAGHRVAMASAADLVMRFTTTHRQPEPTRLAERLVARHPPS